jgi:REP element-mobilizing transposase RayT
MRRYRAPENFCYFCTLTLLDWIPVFIEKRYIEPLLSSLIFCRENKGLILYGFVIMPNHIHLIAEAGEELESVMRDFKRFTSRSIQDILKAEKRTKKERLLESLAEWISSKSDN